MTKLIEIKDKIIRFYGQNETFLAPAVRFVLALALFLTINSNIGYMKAVSTGTIALVLALICGLLPASFTILFAAIVVLLDMYALSVEVLAVTAVLFLAIGVIYFRFAPREGIAAVLTPVTLQLGIPYVMPLGVGLLCQPQGTLAVMFSTIIYYYLDGVKQNEAVFSAVNVEDDGEMSSKFAAAVGQIVENPELLLVLAVFVIVGLAVWVIRRSRLDHAWTAAIVAGGVIEITALLAGEMYLNISVNVPGILLGGIVSILIAFVIQFFCMNLDYERTERVQCEDDEYYYYIKAVPKKLVASEEKVVKHFGNTGNIGRRIERSGHEETSEEAELARKVMDKGFEFDE